MTTRLRRLLGPAFLSAALGGCGESPAAPETLHALTGTVTQNGKAVTGGGLIFVPESGMSGARVIDANVGTDGRFEVRTSSLKDVPAVFKSGAPAGTYKVTYHPQSDGARSGLQTELEQAVTVEAKANIAEIVLPAASPKGVGAARDDANP